MLKKIGYWMSVAVIGTLVGFSLQFAKAWTEPTAAPPTGNVGAPLNTGSVAQGRMGNLGIGTTTPGDRLHVEGAVRIRSGAPQLKMYESDNSENYYNLVVDGGRFGIRYNNGYPGPFQIESNGEVGIRDNLVVDGKVGIGTDDLWNGKFKVCDSGACYWISRDLVNKGEDTRVAHPWCASDTCNGDGEGTFTCNVWSEHECCDRYGYWVETWWGPQWVAGYAKVNCRLAYSMVAHND